MQADDSVAQDLMGSTLSGMMTQVVEEKPVNSPGTQAYLDRMSQNYFVCDGCGYIGKGDTPVKCPVCSAEGDRFKQVDKTIFEAAAKAEGGLETDLAYDDVPMQWTKDAKEAIRAVPAGFQRRRAKAKIEKECPQARHDHNYAGICRSDDSRGGSGRLYAHLCKQGYGNHSSTVP